MYNPICNEWRVISIAIGTSVKCYSPKPFSPFKVSLELSFSRIMCAHMLQRLLETSIKPNTCNFFLGLLIRRICCLLNTCGIGSKDELMLRKEAIWNSLPQGDIQNLFDSMPRRIAALIAARGGYTKY
ncbi:UNVERIFIED_CONTAM: hypothetical protein NCL1_35463 [Trichonephila clavipes]